jgi:hypothetical protein
MPWHLQAIRLQWEQNKMQARQLTIAPIQILTIIHPVIIAT